jgi:hypothetical protein
LRRQVSRISPWSAPLLKSWRATRVWWQVWAWLLCRSSHRRPHWCWNQEWLCRRTPLHYCVRPPNFSFPFDVLLLRLW